MAGEMREERKVVTALFADVVGSTQLTERMDPEDARDARRRRSADGGCGRGVRRHGQGSRRRRDPRAVRGAGDARGRCRARDPRALRIVERTDDGGPPLEIQVGIETGLVVLGPIGGGGQVEYGATGDALNTAARLQSHAPPGRVLVGDVTRRAAGDRFAWGRSSGSS